MCSSACDASRQQGTLLSTRQTQCAILTGSSFKIQRSCKHWRRDLGGSVRAGTAGNNDGSLPMVITPCSIGHSHAHHGLRSCSAPLLGPSLGPIIGGILTQAFGWRATFWFLVIFTGLCIIPFVFFRDTFRRERSLSYQAVLKKHREREAKKAEAAKDTQHAPSRPESPDDGRAEVKSECSSVETKVDVDLEAHVPKIHSSATPKEIKLSLKDVNPIRPMIDVLRCPNNVVIIIASGALLILCVRGAGVYTRFSIIVCV